MTFLLIILLIPSGFAYEYDINPYTVDYSVIKITQRIKFFAMNVEGIEVFSYIPQNDFFQKVLSIEADENYTLVKDRFGNTMLKFSPSKDEITITTILEIKRRKAIASNISFPYESNLTLLNSNFPLAFAYGAEHEKFGNMAKWVYDNLEYDENYGDKVLSAREVFVKRRGVCDEYATLYIAFLRKLGYRASYEVGYAFDGERFRPHGWARIYSNELLDIDPTFCEMPVDALHIKFASLPDPVFNETKVIARGYEPEIKIYPQEINFEILNYTQNPVVKSRFDFLEKKAYSNSYALGKLELSSQECVLTTLTFGECVDENGKSVVKPYLYPKCVYFCGNAEYFSVFSISNISYAAKCSISAKPGAGESRKATLELINDKTDKKAWLSVEKDKVRRGEKIKVESNGHIFTLDGKYAFREGIFEIYRNTTIYALSGTLEKKKITVVEDVPFEAFIKNVILKNNFTILTVSIKNLIERDIMVNLESDIEISLLLPRGETREVNITSQRTNPVEVKISYGEFSLILSKSLELQEKKREENVISVLQKIIKQIIEFLSSLI